MATAAQLMYGVAVEDRASAPLNTIAGAADRAGAAAEAMETRVRRGATTFAEAAGRLDAVEKATTRVEQATARVTRTMEAAEAAARAEGVAQERLNAVLASGAQAREAAALAAVRGFTAEQQAAALTRTGYASLAAQVQATAQAQSALGVRAATGLAAANDNVTASSGRMSTVLGQAGFQVQDFATQVSMGQNALMAFGVQGAQLAGVFGPTGAIAGAALMIGVIAAQLLTIGDNSQEAARRAEAAFEGVKRETEELADLTEKVNELYLTQEERVRRVAAAAREAMASMTGLQQSSLAMQLNSLATELPTAQADVARLQREADVERQLQDRARRAGGMVPQDNGQDIQSRLFTAQSRLMGLQQEIGRVDALLERANRNATDLAANLPLPPLEPPNDDRAARSERMSEAMREYNQIMRDAESQITRTLTEEERRAAVLDRLSQMLAYGEITGDQYVAAMEAQRRAVAALAEQEQRRESERSAAEAARTATRAAEQAERQNQQVTDSIVRYGADRFAGMFAENSRGWAGMLQTFRSTARSIFARIAAEAVIRPIIAPVVQGLGLGQLGLTGSGGLNLGGIGAAGTPASSGGGFSLSSLGSIRTAYDSLSNPGRLGAFFPGGGSFNTGFSGLDGALNANAFQGAFPSEAGFQAIVDGTGATTGASFGQLLGPAASIAGGAYGIYTGLNRGGVGGYTSALGGAVSAGTGLAMLGSAAGLLPALGALGPIGLAAGAVLAIAGALLPGGKPSGQGQLARTNLATDALSFEGLGGSRFSQGNRDAATNAVSGISALVKEIGDKLGGATLGGNAAVGVTNGTLYLDVNGQQAQFGNNAEGAKQLSEAAARFVLEEFRRQGTVGGDYAGILNASGTPDALAQNLQWYDQVYKKIIASTPAVSAYEKAIEGVWNQFEPAIQKARELSIATDELTRAREDEYRRVYLERERAVKSFDDDVFIRTLRAQGNVYADLLAFDAAMPQQLREVRTSLEALGLSAEDVSTRISQVEYAAGLERLNIIKAAKEEENRVAQQAAEAQVQSARGVLDWLNAQSLGALSSLSPTARLAEAERQFNSAFAAGDARGVTGAADALLSASRDVFGGATAAYAEREAFVRQSVGQVGLRAAQAGGNGDVVAALGQVIVELRASLEALRVEVAAGNSERRLATGASLAA